MSDTTPSPSPTAPTEPTPAQPSVDINQQCVDAISALGAVPVSLIIAIDGTALLAERNIILPQGWRWATGYVEQPK